MAAETGNRSEALADEAKTLSNWLASAKPDTGTHKRAREASLRSFVTRVLTRESPHGN